jgi:hypothetical protein
MNIDQINEYTISVVSVYQIFLKLCKDNYFTWGASMQMVLETTNQWKVMTGELTGLMRKDTDTPIQVKLEAKAAWDL